MVTGGAMVVEIDLAAYFFIFLGIALQHYLVLWAAAAIAGMRRGWTHLAFGGAVGALHDIAADLAGFGLLPYAAAWRSWYSVLLATILTFAVAFLPADWRKLRWALVYYYLLAFLSVGGAMAVQRFFPGQWVGPVASMAITLVAAEMGWGVVHRWMWERVLYIPAEIRIGSQRARVMALLDTGNTLRDPLSGAPVMIVGSEMLPDLLPELFRSEGYAGEKGGAAREEQREEAARAILNVDLDRIAEYLQTSPLAARVRLIPFVSIGRENGLLVGIRTDEVWMRQGNTMVSLKGVVVGFHGRPLSADGSYQALINPAVVQEVLEKERRREGAVPKKE